MSYNGMTLDQTDVKLDITERSEWQCDMFGCGDFISFRPTKGNEPCWFWRKMQYLLCGNKWRKDAK